jgi:hypothetical protein
MALPSAGHPVFKFTAAAKLEKQVGRRSDVIMDWT